ncbi:hypothetical protein BJ165DRAFT_1615408 [Panaeolus papilionaceus]|nr:hypothetical protein BJ165DRAFT_1615408 [Panaeolus papilionaceus]
MEPIVLPYDVIGIIFEYLATNREDQGDLQSCSLVCKDWLPIGRQHIFRRVTLFFGGESDRKRAMHLMTIIHQQPSIRRLIQKIFCGCNSEFTNSRWSHPMFLNMLNFPCVRLLSIRADYINDISYDQWSADQLGPRLIMEHYLGAGTLKYFNIYGVKHVPITALVSSKQLSSVHFFRSSPESTTRRSLSDVQLSLKQFKISDTRNVDFSIFHSCPLLEELSVSKVTLIPRGTHNFSKPSAVPPFYHLHTINSRSGVNWSALCPPRHVIGTKLFPVLRNLKLYFLHLSDIVEGNAILDHVEALEVVYVYSWQTGGLSLFDFHRLMFNSKRTLKEVLFDWFLDGYNQLDEFTKRICDVLELIQGDNALETVAFHLTYNAMTAEPDLNSDFPQWKRFADILQDDAGFSNLKQISFKIKLIVTSVTFEQEANRNLEHLWEAPLAGLLNSSRFSSQMDMKVSKYFRDG